MVRLDYSEDIHNAFKTYQEQVNKVVDAEKKSNPQDDDN